MLINDSASAKLAALRTEVATGQRYQPRSSYMDVSYPRQKVRRRSYSDIMCDFLRNLGPATAEHLAGSLGIPYATVAGRMADLKRWGVGEFCGYRYTSRRRLASMYRLVRAIG